MTATPRDVAEFLDEVTTFVEAIVKSNCKDCEEYKYGNNYECFCTDVLKMLDDHCETIGVRKNGGYDDFVCKEWNCKQRRQQTESYRDE